MSMRKSRNPGASCIEKFGRHVIMAVNYYGAGREYSMKTAYFVSPGFIDSHMHVLSFGDALNCVPLHLPQ